jgi:hypothetical protein
MNRFPRALLIFLLAVCCTALALPAAETVEQPFAGITHITRTETSPRNVTMHVVEIELGAAGIHFELTPPGGSLETVRQTTLTFLKQVHAQVAINAHFFLPFPSDNPESSVIGFAASSGNIYSGFETPSQSYSIVANAPAINIDPANHATIVHDTSFSDGKRPQENVTVWNALSGSAQIVTSGGRTIPAYADEKNPGGLLTPGGERSYSNTNSWYDVTTARSAIGLSQDDRTLVLFTVDRAGGSLGMTVGEVADLLIRDYHVYNALNLDGGGSTTLAMEDPATHVARVINTPSEGPDGRSVGSSLAVFATGGASPRTEAK